MKDGRKAAINRRNSNKGDGGRGTDGWKEMEGGWTGGGGLSLETVLYRCEDGSRTYLKETLRLRECSVSDISIVSLI